MKTTTSSNTKSRKKTAGRDGSAARQNRIAEQAYLIAERAGFPAGRELDFWLEAERAVDGAVPAAASAAKTKKKPKTLN